MPVDNLLVECHELLMPWGILAQPEFLGRAAASILAKPLPFPIDDERQPRFNQNVSDGAGLLAAALSGDDLVPMEFLEHGDDGVLRTGEVVLGITWHLEGIQFDGVVSDGQILRRDRPGIGLRLLHLIRDILLNKFDILFEIESLCAPRRAIKGFLQKAHHTSCSGLPFTVSGPRVVAHPFVVIQKLRL